LTTWRTPGGDFEAELKKHDAEITYLAPSWYCLFAGKGDFPTQLIAPSTDMQVAPRDDIIKYCQQVSQNFDSHKKQLALVYGDYWPPKSKSNTPRP
jgi:fructosamine-3-kinase